MLIRNEIPLYSPAFGGFAGTFDLLIDTTLYEIKCTEQVQREAELQLVGQHWLCAANRIPVEHKKVLQLKGNATYEIHDHSAIPFPLWASVMDIYRWKVRNQ